MQLAWSLNQADWAMGMPKLALTAATEPGGPDLGSEGSNVSRQRQRHGLKTRQQS